MEFICNCNVLHNLFKKIMSCYKETLIIIETMNNTVYQWRIKWTSKVLQIIFVLFTWEIKTYF